MTVLATSLNKHRIKMSTLKEIEIQDFRRTKIFLTSVVTALILGLLLWEHFHGGVPSHHVLQRNDLPELSNWLGALILPVLTWILLGRVQTRVRQQVSQPANPENQKFRIYGLFLAGLTLAILLVVSFTNNYKFFLDNVPYLFLLLALFIPIYYAEFILGFVLGMTYTFGAILPAVFVLILAGIGFLVYRFIRPLLLKLANSGTKKRS